MSSVKLYRYHKTILKNLIDPIIADRAFTESHTRFHVLFMSALLTYIRGLPHQESSHLQNTWLVCGKELHQLDKNKSQCRARHMGQGIISITRQPLRSDSNLRRCKRADKCCCFSKWSASTIRIITYYADQL